jgi:hypothetical protein
MTVEFPAVLTGKRRANRLSSSDLNFPTQSFRFPAWSWDASNSPSHLFDQSMARLDQLPPELIGLVLDFLCNRRADLGSLALANKDLFLFHARHHLFRRLAFTSLATTQPLVSLLENDVQLAAMVKEVVLLVDSHVLQAVGNIITRLSALRAVYFTVGVDKLSSGIDFVWQDLHKTNVQVVHINGPAFNEQSFESPPPAIPVTTLVLRRVDKSCASKLSHLITPKLRRLQCLNGVPVLPPRIWQSLEELYIQPDSISSRLALSFCSPSITDRNISNLLGSFSVGSISLSFRVWQISLTSDRLF